MPRRVQDIIPGDRKTIRNIPLKKDQPTMTKAEIKIADEKYDKKVDKVPVHVTTDAKEPVSSHKMSLTPPPVSRRKPRGSGGGHGGRWLLITLGIIIIVAGLGYVASVYFSRATITITPHTLPVAINGIYLAQNNTVVGSKATSSLVYQLLTVKGSATTTVQATTGATVSTKAQGPVTLYNSFANQPQRLVAGTRFSDADGKIYHLLSTTVIPGMGSTKATIVADQPGDTYNILASGSVSDLQVVAYKGSDRYGKIYARPSGEITGGFIGSQKVVANNVLASSTADLQKNITASLLEQARGSVPDGYIMYDSGAVSTFATPKVVTSDVTTDAKSAQVSLQGTLSALIFNEKDLTTKLAGATGIASFGGYPYTTTGLNTLDVSVVGLKNASTSLSQTKDPVSFRIKGGIKLTAIIPTAEIQKKLAGASLSDIPTILKPYASIIEKVSAELMPTWSKISPDPGRTSVVISSK